MTTKEILPRLYNFYTNYRRLPSYTELTELAGYKSKQAAFSLADKLSEEGYIQKSPKGKLVPGDRFWEVPILGTVAAGFPTMAEEERLDTLTLDEWLLQNRQATYLLKVEGDSMKDAGILPGDFVLVERTSHAKPGDIVVAEVDGDWTMKYLRRNASGQTVLMPANDAYEPIMPLQHLHISAVVRSVIRRYDTHSRTF